MDSLMGQICKLRLGKNNRLHKQTLYGEPKEMGWVGGDICLAGFGWKWSAQMINCFQT